MLLQQRGGGGWGWQRARTRAGGACWEQQACKNTGRPIRHFQSAGIKGDAWRGRVMRLVHAAAEDVFYRLGTADVSAAFVSR